MTLLSCMSMISNNNTNAILQKNQGRLSSPFPISLKPLFPFSRILPHTRAHQFPRHGGIARDAIGRAGLLQRAKPLRLLLYLVALLLQMRQRADVFFDIG